MIPRRSLALYASVVLAGALAFATPVSTSSAQAVPQVFFSESVRARLARDWNERDARQTERAYCVTWVRDTPREWQARGVYITRISPAEVKWADPQNIHYVCSRSDSTTTLHTHTPATCLKTADGLVSDYRCELGGPEANLCSPSHQDMYSLWKTGQPFALIQCARDAIVPFWTAAAHQAAEAAFITSWTSKQ